MSSRPISLVLAVGSIAGVLVCLYLAATTPLTAQETILLSVILTIASMLGSWVASQYYAEQSYSSSLKTFALKAAEKVHNLSNELDRLSAYLQRELTAQDYKTTDEALLARDMSIEAAVHMVGTLRSVNDGALSDWRGVIGKELEEQEELREEREQEFRELVSRLEQLEAAQPTPETPHKSEDVTALRGELETLRADLRVLGSHLGAVPPSRRPRFPLTKVETKCPECGSTVTYKHKAKPDQPKPVKCPACQAKLLSTFVDGAFLLKVRKPIQEKVQCPACSQEILVPVDPFLGVQSLQACPDCGASVGVTRTKSGLSVRSAQGTLAKKEPLAAGVDDAFVEQVRQLMPPQPWPKGAVAQLATRLGVSNTTVNRALQVLIHRGNFKLQIGGKLYEPLPSPEPASQGHV